MGVKSVWLRKCLISAQAAVGHLHAFVMRYWNYDFRNFRLIFEQEGHVHYFYVTVNAQRVLARSCFFAAVILTASIIGNGLLWWSNSRLQASHQKIFEALMEATNPEGSEGIPKLNDDQMIELANSIRDRDSALREYITATEGLVSKENDALSQNLLSTGLKKEQLEKNGKSNAGGLSSESASVLLNQQALIELNKNRRLKELFATLPKGVPMESYEFSSGYGVRMHPVTNKPDFHAGLDLRPKGNGAVKATMAGTVVLASYNGNYGNTVVVRHSKDVTTLYAHLSKISVREGEQVLEGTQLGVAGNSGLSTGVHLHYEIMVDDKPINPSKVIGKDA